MTPEQQLLKLQRTDNEALRILGRSLLTLAAVLLCAAAYHYHEAMFAMAGVFLAVVALSIWKSAPHRRHAVRASRQGIPYSSTLTITVTESSDASAYQATVRDRFGTSWEFEFLPQGWKPAAGQTPAELFSIADIAWPVLIRTEHGILYPRYTPKRLETASASLSSPSLKKERP